METSGWSHVSKLLDIKSVIFVASSRRPSVVVASALFLVSTFGGGVRAEDNAHDCVINPALEVKIGSPVVGLLADVPVDRGTEVHEDMIIARLESSVETATVALARLRGESTAEVASSRTQLRLAQQKLKRADELLRRQVIATERIEELRAEKQVGEGDLKIAQMNRELATLELERAEAILAQREIRSPINGVVTERLLAAGEYVHQEAYIMTIAKFDPLHVEVYLPVSMYPTVVEGMFAQVMPQEPIGGKYSAQVIVVDRKLDAASSTFGVRLLLQNPGGKLPGGLRCRIVFPSVS